jgi:hypothetical protein
MLQSDRSGVLFFIALSLIFVAISWYAAHEGAAVG